MTRFPSGKPCSVVFPTPCPSTAPPGVPPACPDGEVDFGDGDCVKVCPPGLVDLGDGCAGPPAAECKGKCITAFAGTRDNAGTCVAL